MTSCPVSGARSAPAMRLDSEALFHHPDKTDKVDALDDPLREIAEKLHAMGDVAIGCGAGDPLGSEVLFGDVMLPNMFVGTNMCRGTVYAAVSFRAARAVYANARLFSTGAYSDTLRVWGKLINATDPPDHGKYRKIMQVGFTPEAVARYEHEIVRPTIERHFSSVRQAGKADLVRELTPYNAYEITGRIAGFDPSDIALVADCFGRMNGGNHDPQAFLEAVKDLRDYAGSLVTRTRREPNESLISKMIQSEVDGLPPDDDRLIGLVISLLGGGIDTIYKQSGIVICQLLNNPTLFERLRQDRSRIPAFVDESLRYDGVASMMARQATEDTDLYGVAIPKGAIIFTMQAVADRDPTRWEDPHTFNPDRDFQTTVQFGGGPHICAGAAIARITLSVLIEHLIDDMPNLRWDPAHGPSRTTGWHQRATLSLPVLWDVQAAA